MHINSAVDKGRFVSRVSSAIEVVCLFFVSAVVSWFVALLWSADGDRWMHAQTDFSTKSLYTLVRPVLSSDVVHAEDQLAFLIFWIPSFVMTTAFLLAVTRLHRFLRR